MQVDGREVALSEAGAIYHEIKKLRVLGFGRRKTEFNWPEA